jgi:hypothetical protein
MSVSFAKFIEALGARPSGENYMAGCPGHEDRTPSLSIKQHKSLGALLHCFAGCSTRDRLIPIFEQRGLWPVEADPGHQADICQQRPCPRLDPADFPPFYIDFNKKLVPPERQATERYLRQRGIAVAELREILHHPRAYHQPTGTWWPCMVAAVRDVNGWLRSVHRTFLSYTEPPVKAALGGVTLDPVRMTWLGTSVKGCAVWLAAPAPTLLIGEGLESTAAAMKLHGLPGWAALSAGNLKRHLELPPLVRRVVIAADNDMPGLAAANAAADRFRREGRAVRIIKPKRVKDFNDLLLKGENHAR